MPPLDKPKSDPLIVLLDEIELLSAQTRLMELYLKRAHTAAFGEVVKIQEQFRAKVTNLKARLEDKEYSLSKHLPDFRNEKDQLNSVNQEHPQRISEQHKLLQRYQEECELRGAEVAALCEQLSQLEAAKQDLENAAALRLDQARQELKLQIAQLQSELTQKEQTLLQRDATAKQFEQETQARLRSLAGELADSRESVEQQKVQIQSRERECDELRERVAQLESVNGEGHAQTQRDIDVPRQDLQAKLAALQSEIAHKTVLLTRNQATIAELEQKLMANAEDSRSEAATKQALLENQSAELARRDAEIADLSRRIAELENAAQEQSKAAARELSQAQKAFTSEIAALRADLVEKQRMLEQGQGELEQIEQELRNRNRELQGKLAAKEAVVESLEHNLRHAQTESLAARDALGENERTLADCKRQLTEKEQMIESCCRDIEQTKCDLTIARERLHQTTEERSAIQERAAELAAQVDALKNQLDEKQGSLSNQSEILRETEARLEALCAALGSARNALEEEQQKELRTEQVFAARIAEFQAEFERKEQAMREREASASRAMTVLNVQISELESRLSEKERVLEAREREIGVLQARVESLSGQTARLEATYSQQLQDAAREDDRARRALQAEIATLQFERDKQNVLLAERQAALSATEQRLRADIDALKEQSAERQALIDEQSVELRQAATDTAALRERIAQLEGAIAQIEAAPGSSSASDADRIAALEQKLQSREQTVAELEAALKSSEEQLQHLRGEPRLHLPQEQNAPDQSEQLKAAQVRINELLERLAQLEAARHMLQDNAAHEMQQLRESFESRIEKLRMELAEKDQRPAKDPAVQDQRAVVSPVEEDFQQQILALRDQLAEKHGLLENRNEELIKVKAEMDSLQDYVARLKTARGQESIVSPFSVELKEEDAVDIPRGAVNGSHRPAISRPDPLRMQETEPDASMAIGERPRGGEKSMRFTHLEGRVRSWNPELEKGSAMGSIRRWNMGLFKRRWKA